MPTTRPTVLNRQSNTTLLTQSAARLSLTISVLDPVSTDLDLDDAGRMGDLHEAPLLKLIGRRHASDKIYTWSGHILLSVNPYHIIAGLYEAPAVRETLQRRSSIEASAPPDLTPRSTAQAALKQAADPPHIFSIADAAFSQMDRGVQSQVLVVNGESGAGKTEACRQLMRYIAAASSDTRRRSAEETGGTAAPPEDAVSLSPQALWDGGELAVSSVEGCMLKASPVLEAFGNAKTIRNANSSRFGKLTWLLFSPSSTLMGSSIATSLLEKARLCAQAPDERNFHIFYFLVAGLPPTPEGGDGAAAELDLLPAAECSLLTQGGCLTIEGIDDAAEFRAVDDAMRTLGFSSAQLAAVWALLSGLLHLGNVAFVPATTLPDPGSEATGIESAAPADEGALSRAAKALRCEEVELRRALLERSFEVEGARAQLKHTPTEAAEARDSLLKHLYELLFGWLVHRINAKAAPEAPRARRNSFADFFKQIGDRIGDKGGGGGGTPRAGHGAAGDSAEMSHWQGPRLGLLDIYGFEDLKASRARGWRGAAHPEPPQLQPGPPRPNPTPSPSHDSPLLLHHATAQSHFAPPHNYVVPSCHATQPRASTCLRAQPTAQAPPTPGR